WRTPSTLTHARSPMLAAMIAARGAPDAAAGHRNDSASAKPFASDAIDAIRASQVIQPTSKPTNGPNASRVYKKAPPGSSKWPAASAKQSTSSATASPAKSTPSTLLGPSSAAAAAGSG